MYQDENQNESINVNPRKNSSGFATLIENFQEKSLSLDKYLVKKPAATFFLRAKSEAMQTTVKPEDLLIVDKSLEAMQGNIIIAAYNGEFLCRRYYKFSDHIELRADNPTFSAIIISLKKTEYFSVWGVVTHVIHTTH